MRFLLAALIVLTSFSYSDAQLFRWSSGGSSYQKTDDGYNYRGKHYTLGVDGPVSSTCNCPMCQELRAALQKVDNVQYVPSASRTNVQSAPLVLEKKDVYTQDIGTPPEAIKKMIEILDPEYDALLLDPGCGDARILIEAAKTRFVRGVGIEINPETYQKAKKRVDNENLSGRISLTNADSREYSFKNADYIALFLFPSVIEDLAPKFEELKPGAKVISYMHEIPLEGTEKIGDFYVWIKK